MLRLLFWLVLLAAVGFMLNGDLPIPGVAEEETAYATTPPVSTCGPSGCIVVYTLEVANVGRSMQPSVRVRLRNDALDAPVLAPTVRRASEAVLVAPAEGTNVQSFMIGRLEPEERVALVFALRAPSRAAILGWDRILAGVDPDLGAARPAEVGAITFGRIVNALGRVVHRIVQAVAQR